MQLIQSKAHNPKMENYCIFSQSKLKELFSSIIVIFIGVIAVLVLIDKLGFPNVYYLSQSANHLSLYPPYTTNRGRVTINYIDIHPFSRYVYGDFSINENTPISSIASIKYYQDESLVGSDYYVFPAENYTGASQKFVLVDTHSVNFNQMTISVDARGNITEDTKVSLQFYFYSYKYLYRQIFFRFPFFMCTLTFLIMVIRRALQCQFQYVDCFYLLLLAVISYNPIILFGKSYGFFVVDVVFARILLCSCRFFAALKLLDREFIEYNIWVTIGSVSYALIDMGFAIYGEILYAKDAYYHPTEIEHMKYSPYDYVSFAFLSLAILLVVTRALFKLEPLVSILGFIILELNEFVSFFSTRNMDTTFMYLITLTIPNIFVCDYMMEKPTNSSLKRFASLHLPIRRLTNLGRQSSSDEGAPKIEKKIVDDPKLPI